MPFLSCSTTRNQQSQSFDANNSQVIMSSVDADRPEPKTGTRLYLGVSPILMQLLTKASSAKAAVNILSRVSADPKRLVV